MHPNYRWDDSVAATLAPAERLIYRSNLLGADARITNTGGGNTSSKLGERDPLTGRAVEVLWVKGSGGDLGTATLPNFASLYLDKLHMLQSLYAGSGSRGPKTAAEDAMADLYPHCAFNLNPRAASIDTPLHAFVPFRHVDHMHPNAVIAIAASRRSEQLTREIFGDDVGWTPWLRPGFELGLELGRRTRQEPELKGMVLGQHGLINWADDDRACYDLTLRLINQAATFIDAHDKGERTFGGQRYPLLDPSARDRALFDILPRLRGRSIVTVDSSPAALRFVNSHDAPRLAELGTSCPDHFLRTKIKPLYIPWDSAAGNLDTLRDLLERGLAQYGRDYAAYYDRCKRPDSPTMRDPNPTVILIPGLGLIARGRNKSESRITAEFYNCAIEVMRGAEAIDEYVALPEQEAFDIEYWQLEEAKLKRMPPEKELSRCVVLVTGAGADFGATLSERLAADGAHVVSADADASGALQRAVLDFGGIDHLVAVDESPGDLEELVDLWLRQGLEGSVVQIGKAPLPRLPEAVAPTIRVNGISQTHVELIAFLLSRRGAGIRNQTIGVD